MSRRCTILLTALTVTLLLMATSHVWGQVTRRCRGRQTFSVPSLQKERNILGKGWGSTAPFQPFPVAAREGWLEQRCSKAGTSQSVTMPCYPWLIWGAWQCTHSEFWSYCEIDVLPVKGNIASLWWCTAQLHVGRGGDTDACTAGVSSGAITRDLVWLAAESAASQKSNCPKWRTSGQDKRPYLTPRCQRVAPSPVSLWSLLCWRVRTAASCRSFSDDNCCGCLSLQK